jgi:hypothetical protein
MGSDDRGRFPPMSSGPDDPPTGEFRLAPPRAPDPAFETLAAPVAAPAPAVPDPAFETLAAPVAAAPLRASAVSGPTGVDPFETWASPPAAAPTGASRVVAPPAHRVGRSSAVGALVAVAAAGVLVAVALGVYGRLHEPQPAAVNVAGFSGPGEVKSWLATLAFVLGVVQLGSAMVMWGRIPRVTAPSWLGGLHRWSGRVAVIATVPVAVHCLYVLGFLYDTPRVLVHSLLGCLFYGVFVTKMLLLSRDDPAPGWVLPVVGGVTFTALTGLWLTSAVWFFATTGIHL